MSRLELLVQKRSFDKKESPALKDKMYGVVYGSKVNSFPIWVNTVQFRKVFAETGENTLLDLHVEGDGRHVVLVHDVQYSPMRGTPIHVDFFVVNMKEEVETAVPLEFIGVSPAVKEEAGVLVKNMEEIEIRCLPNDIPKSFIVDLSVLKDFDDCIYVKDIVHSEKYEALLDGESAVVLVARPREVEEEVSTAPISDVAEVVVKSEEKTEEKK